MSAMETDEMVRKVMKTIRIEGELFRSHENGLKEGLEEGKEIGHANGLEEGKEIGHASGLEEGKEIGHASGLEEGRSDTERKFILKLLEKYSPREISCDYDVPLERVMEIKNENK